MDTRRLLIVSGLSGAGKTVALHALEDAGYYCVDNLPVGILPAFASYIVEQGSPHFERVAIGVDARNHPSSIAALPETLEALRERDFDAELIFIDASEETLLHRFSETRRKHPLSSDELSLEDAIRRERKLLDVVIDRADLRIDTSRSNVHEFRNVVRDRIANKPPGSIALQFRSFGFKFGVPGDADFVFDLRCLPNPYWEPSLRELTGLDLPVREFLDGSKLVDEMAGDVAAFLDRWIDRFEEGNRAYLTVAFGCTGGRHRSVYMAERMARRYDREDTHVVLSHCDAPLPTGERGA